MIAFENGKPATRIAYVIFALTLFLLFSCSKPRRESAAAPPTPEEKAYLGQIAVTSERMWTAENFLNERVVTMTAVVTNKGTKKVASLTLDLAFTDMEGKIVQHETVRPITDHAAPLKPGEARSFSASFEKMSDAWDQAAPKATPISVELE